MQQEIITSLDFGTQKLSATVAIREKDELKILGVQSCKSAGIEKGLLLDIDKCRDVAVSLLKDLEKKMTVKSERISIGISSNKVRVTEVSTVVNIQEKVTSADIRKALKNAQRDFILSDDESIVNVLINFYILDNKVIRKDILNWKGSKLEINLTLVIAAKSEIEKYYELFRKTEYNIGSIKLNILVGKQVFLNEKNSMESIVIADIGAGTTDIALFTDGIPKSINSIPIGGRNITKDLAICGKFSFLKADNMKKIYSSNYKALYLDNSLEEEIEVGTTKVSRKLFYEVVNARIEEILSHINIKLKNTGHYDRICSIILYGDGVNYFEDIDEIVRKIFKIKTKVIRKNDLGIKNSENITSMAIAKEVYDRLNLLEDDNIILTNKHNDNKVINEKEHLHNNEGENHILKKVKVFFDKIF